MPPITLAILVIALVALTGLLLGSVRVRGIGLGPAGVLFAGILFGHFGASIDPEIAHFAKEFGLILFVFTIGLQLGPGIVQLWKQQGLLLNGLALLIVLQGLLLVIGFLYLLDLPAVTAAGLFSGATTNTPSLGAAEQTATALGSERVGPLENLASAYAVAYPGAIVGIIVSMLLIRRLFAVNVQQEAESLRASEVNHHEKIERMSVQVDNANLDGSVFGQIPGIEETAVRISRIKRSGEQDVHAATEETLIHSGDVIQIVGPQSGLRRFAPLIGRKSDWDLMTTSGDAEFRRVFVTDPRVLNHTLRELSLDKYFNTSVTRIYRAGLEMTASGSSKFHYGDVAHIVGDRNSLDRATAFLGNSGKSLKETPFSPLFLGIAAGVLLGEIPFSIPGVPFPIKLGLAGGPLIAAIVLSLVGNIGKFVWYIPYSANLALRELGIILFLACAGLGAGSTYFAAVTSLDGLKWMIAGLVVTMVPLLTTAALARLVWKQNYLTICGVIAGSMTDPPALAFANSLAESQAPATSYAAVYPLTMILRIIAAQAIVFLFS
ncbi:putative transporter [Roseiconus nitratireducens]|uniref:Putative transporter n=1 Tax=Roseiconus nitratireducens TaxID=2605748 RepID=A0A5M6D8Q9_9BACT|nr:putative transporter [Roseiconus nitratireducens]KAA5543733.1 putative transporter [Roseiconus nitratireducens]